LGWRDPLGTNNCTAFIEPFKDFLDPIYLQAVIIHSGNGDVEKGCRAVLSVIKGVVDSADETMSLFICGVPRSESELMGR
jgi:hypothetical protein